jgi:Sec-independent protein translocase protein TatA
MFGISFAEILIVAVIAFLIVGPKKMGDLLFQVGKFWRKFQDEWGKLNIQKQINDVTKATLTGTDETKKDRDTKDT